MHLFFFTFVPLFLLYHSLFTHLALPFYFTCVDISLVYLHCVDCLFTYLIHLAAFYFSMLTSLYSQGSLFSPFSTLLLCYLFMLLRILVAYSFSFYFLVFLFYLIIFILFTHRAHCFALFHHCFIILSYLVHYYLLLSFWLVSFIPFCVLPLLLHGCSPRCMFYYYCYLFLFLYFYLVSVLVRISECTTPVASHVLIACTCAHWYFISAVVFSPCIHSHVHV